MDELLDQLLAKTGEMPSELGVIEIRRASVDDLQRRLRKFLRGSAEACPGAADPGDWTSTDALTVVRLPRGARAEVFHASGAMRLYSGTPTMENLFKEVPPRGQLVAQCEQWLRALGLAQAAGRNETLQFERLWLSKAAGEDRQGRRSDPVLCRAVGAFRHHVEGIPVFGPASVAVQLAGGGSLDSISVLMRGPLGETLERARLLSPERAARTLAQQLGSAATAAKGERHIECKEGLRLGYLSLPKRKPQRVMAPVYVAVIDISHEQEAQGLVCVVPATEANHLPLNAPGSESPIVAVSKNAMRKCC